MCYEMHTYSGCFFGFCVCLLFSTCLWGRYLNNNSKNVKEIANTTTLSPTDQLFIDDAFENASNILKKNDLIASPEMPATTEMRIQILLLRELMLQVLMMPHNLEKQQPLAINLNWTTYDGSVNRRNF